VTAQAAGPADDGYQAGEGSEVLLAVAAFEHLGGEHAVEGDAAGQEGEVAVVHAVGEDDQAEGYVLVGEFADVDDADGLDAVERAPYLLGAVRRGAGRVDEVVAGCRGSPGRRLGDAFVGPGSWSHGRPRWR